MNIFDIQCRACMCKKIKYQKFHTLRDIEMGMKVHEIFKCITPQLEIKEQDSLPQFICVGCFVKLKNAFQFQQICIESDKKYRELDKLKKENRSDAIADGTIKITSCSHKAYVPNKRQISSTKHIKVKDEDINIEEISRTLEKNEIFLEEPTTTLIASMKAEFATEDGAETFQNCDPLQNDDEEFDENETYICTECKKVFKTQRLLKNHSRLHTNEKSYICPQCGKGFKNKGNLTQHIPRHSKDWRYQCPHCPKKFPCPSGVIKHQSIHSNVKNHICEICGSTFKRSYSLRKHMKIHAGIRKHKCEQCPATFINGNNLKRHMLTHTGEKPYKCQYCNRAFAQSNDLKKHLRLHLGEKIYKCTQCKEAFKYHVELMEHQFKHPIETPKKSQTLEISQTKELSDTIIKEELTI